MRVQGNAVPDSIHIEPYASLAGFVEVRLRENISPDTDAMYEYDEYVLHIKARDGLQDEIETNLADWLATGRTLEVNPMASAVQDMEEALQLLGISVEGDTNK